MEKLDSNRVAHIVQAILDDYGDDRAVNKTDLYNQPDKKAILELVEKLLQLLYPGYYGERERKLFSLEHYMAAAVEDVIFHLHKQIAAVLRYSGDEAGGLEDRAREMTFAFMERIPRIRAVLDTDIQAAFDGDPAANSRDEVILSYPGLYAISVYRIAHELFTIGVPMIPRIMTEHAHSVTGIDIHPGAQIGDYFFMDHGTGIVIGETAVIGSHVKIYQGVTLGGLSTKGGQKLKGIKRHPTIGDNVTIYSGASILGGDTVIEADVVVGGNAFVTQSVPRGSRVSMKTQSAPKSE